jgi:hypothetical protein
MDQNRILLLAGWLSTAVAALHVVSLFLGAPAYRYFGAGERMARQAEQGSLYPIVVTVAVTVAFAVFALYAFVGAGLALRLPLLRSGLAIITAIYLLRGLVLLPQLALYARGSTNVPFRWLVFSFLSLAIGALYLLGTIRLWQR